MDRAVLNHSVSNHLAYGAPVVYQKPANTERAIVLGILSFIYCNFGVFVCCKLANAFGHFCIVHHRKIQRLLNIFLAIAMRMIALKPAHFHGYVPHYNFGSLANKVLQRNVQALERK
jgi:hypothetical protein